jgi:hypothetical protein
MSPEKQGVFQLLKEVNLRLLADAMGCDGNKGQNEYRFFQTLNLSVLHTLYPSFGLSSDRLTK